jgi:hypothetical protein
MRTAILFVACAIVLYGCANPPCEKPGANQQDFRADLLACEWDAQAHYVFGIGLIGQQNRWRVRDECLVAHGWKAVP